MISLFHYCNGYLLFHGSELKCLEYMDKCRYYAVNKYHDSWYVEGY